MYNVICTHYQIWEQRMQLLNTFLIQMIDRDIQRRDGRVVVLIHSLFHRSEALKLQQQQFFLLLLLQ